MLHGAHITPGDPFLARSQAARGTTQNVLARFSSRMLWHGILVYCVGTVFLFKALARYSCLVAAFILEGGAEEHA